MLTRNPDTAKICEDCGKLIDESWFKHSEKLCPECLHNCPICKGEIDTEHHAFVMEVMKDADKMKAWMDKKLTFKKWKESK